MAASIELQDLEQHSNDQELPVLIRPNSQVVEVQQPIVLLNDIHLASEIIVEANTNEENDDVISVASSTSTNNSNNAVSRETTPFHDGNNEKVETEENGQSDDETDSNSRKRSRSEYENEDDGQLCSICLDNWTNSGEHRICCLKCGHLFGYSCIVRWMQSQTKKSCPTCKKRVTKSEIRFLYTKKLIAVDNSELQEMKEKLDCVINERNNIQLELSKYICREHALNQEINFLKSQLQTYKNNPLLFSGTSSISSQVRVKLYMDKSMEVCPAGACRVFDVNPVLDLLMVNVKSPNALFSGFGLRKICFSQYKTLAFLPLHTAQIRDVSFQNTSVLSVSMDKMVKITDSLNNSTICSFSQTLPLWSCCWDSSDANYFYIGTQMGTVQKYDLRALGQPMNVLDVPGDMSPVVSVAHIPSEANGLQQDGIVSCKLNSIWFFEKTQSEYVRHPLGIDGPFYAMRYDNASKHILVSSRPNQRNPNSRHTLATLTKVGDKVTSSSVHTFENRGIQKHLSRSCFVKRDQDFIAVHEESSKLVSLWNINNGTKACSVTAHDPVLDLRAVVNTDYDVLVGLTDKKILFYKFS